MKWKTYKSGCYTLEVRFDKTPLITLYSGKEVKKCVEKSEKESLYVACQKVISNYMKKGGYDEWWQINKLVNDMCGVKEYKRDSKCYEVYMKSDYIKHLNNLIKAVWDDPDINPWNG